MRFRRGILAVALLSSGGAISAAGETGRLSVDILNGSCKGTLQRVSLAERTLWQRAIAFPKVLDLAPAEADTWLRASCPGFWSLPLELPAGALGDNLSLTLLPAGSVHGKLIRPATGPPLKSLAIRMLRATGIGSAVHPVLSPCKLDGVAFQCDLPAEKLDLALVVPGFSPVYLWGFEVKRKVDREISPVRLSVGASVAGWVVAPSSSPNPVMLEVVPETTGWQSDPVAQRARLRVTQSPADDRGFFQLTGLSPGFYRLRASRSDLAQVDRPIELHKGEELLLPQPLRLDPPITLEAFIRPAVAGGKPLGCVLEREVPRTNVMEQVARGKVNLDGYCSASKLVPGRYTFRIVDDSDSTLYVSEIEVEPGMEPLSIDLDFVEVEGRVTVGDSDPLQGNVVFGTLNRQPNVSVPSDEEGRFTALLPRDGEWPVDVVEDGTTHRAPTVDVHRREDGKPTWVEVKLPDTLVSGTVREKGEPVGHAIVLAQRKEAGEIRREAFTQSRQDGTFRLRGVRAGELLLRAYTQTSSSRWQSLHLENEGKPAGVDLLLNRQVEIAVSVLGPQGPISGAYVVAFPVINGITEPWTLRGVTEADGKFIWKDVDGMAEALDILVVAAGYGVRLLRAPTAGNGAPLVIGLSEGKGELVFDRESLTRGNVLVMGDARLPLAEVILPSFLQAGLAIDGKEGLTLAGLAPGHYSLCGPLQTSCTTGELRENERISLGSPQ